MVQFSIILPTYNVSRYIETCIKSFIEQDFKDYEIIIVDDGSTDNLWDVVSKYVDNHQIKYIRQDNQGVSVARNTGIEAATGEYIYMCDSDDYVSKDLLRVLKSQIDRFKFDIISFNNRRDSYDIDGNCIESKIEGFPFCEYYEKKDIVYSILPKHMGTTQKELDLTKHNGCVMSFHIVTGVWLMCFKRDFLNRNNIRFVPGMKLGEDRLFISQAIIYSNSFLHLETPLYVYSFRKDGCFTKILSNNNGLFDVRKKWLYEYSQLRDRVMRELGIDIFPYYIVTCLLFLDNVLISLRCIRLSDAYTKLNSFINIEDVRNAIKNINLRECSYYYKIRFGIYKLKLAHLLLFYYRLRFVFTERHS